MRIVIFGASGATGKHLVEQALYSGYLVTAFVRDARRLPVTHSGLRVIEGDVKDRDAVLHAVSGHAAVISALGANRVTQFDQVVVDGLTNIISAMEQSGNRRLIYLSTLGVSASRTRAGLLIRVLAPTVLRHEIRGHELREAIIQQSSVSYTIVRAPILTNGPRTRVYRVERDLRSRKFATALSRADVASCLLSQLTHDRFVQQAVSLIPFS